MIEKREGHDLAGVNGRDGGLPPDAALLLRAVWTRATSGAPIPRADVREIACRVSALAHAANMLPEQVIRGVKENWRSFTGFGSAGERDAQEPLLADLISQCIREFYRGASELPDLPGDALARARIPGNYAPEPGHASPDMR